MGGLQGEAEVELNALMASVFAHQIECGRDMWHVTTDDWAVFLVAIRASFHLVIEEVESAGPAIFEWMGEVDGGFGAVGSPLETGVEADGGRQVPTSYFAVDLESGADSLVALAILGGRDERRQTGSDLSAEHLLVFAQIGKCDTAMNQAPRQAGSIPGKDGVVLAICFGISHGGQQSDEK